MKTKFSDGGWGVELDAKPAMPESVALDLEIFFAHESPGKAAPVKEIEDVCKMFLCMKEEVPDLKDDKRLKDVASKAAELLEALCLLGEEEVNHIGDTGLALPMQTIKTIVEGLSKVGPRKRKNEPKMYLVSDLTELFVLHTGRRPTRTNAYVSEFKQEESGPLVELLRILDPYIGCGTCGSYIKRISQQAKITNKNLMDG